MPLRAASLRPCERCPPPAPRPPSRLPAPRVTALPWRVSWTAPPALLWARSRGSGSRSGWPPPTTTRRSRACCWTAAAWFERVDACDPKMGRSPLWKAALNGHARAVRLLLAHGADPRKAKRTDGSSPLFVAAEFGHAPVVALLLAALTESAPAEDAPAGDAPAGDAAVVVEVDTPRASDGATPLFAACKGGHAAAAALLLDAGADPNRKVPLPPPAADPTGGAASGGTVAERGSTTPLAAAAAGGHRRVVDLPLLRGALSTPLFPTL
mmetsp:Transcript_47205/g.106980  ORF Transcript_47205/g.106980 Transcript_47205/m.106980 type:complete len:268 (-) Transcript_47205:100-903(-)